MMIAYHVTPAQCVASILRTGLEPRIGPRSLDLGEERPAVYFFVDLKQCEQALMNWLGDALDEEVEIAFLEVDLTGMNVNAELGWELRVENAIHPQRILSVRSESQFQQMLESMTAPRYRA